MTHARLYLANDMKVVEALTPLMQPTTDIEHFVRDAFSINDVRELQERAQRLPVVRATYDFVVTFSSATVEAQNALLKMLEEPPVSTVIHIVVPREEVLLPTVHSRLQLVESVEVDVEQAEFSSFLELTHGERIILIAEKAKAKDTAWMEMVLTGAELHTRTGAPALQQSILLVRQSFNTRGASNKMLLEEIALALPRASESV